MSFSHHEAVAALAPAEQDGLLDQAEREGWSRQRLRHAAHSTKPVVGVTVRSIESSARRSITVPTTKAVDRITILRVSEAASSPITYGSPPVVPPPALSDQSPLTNPDMTKGSAREAESDLAHFLEQFENSYEAIQGFAPVIERMREAQAMLSQIAL